MKKLIFLLPLLFIIACKADAPRPNVAEIRVKSDVTNVKCSSGFLSDGTSVTKCTVPSKDGKQSVTFIGAVGGEFPFHSWPYRTNAQLEDLAKTQAAEQGSGSAALVTPVAPDAGVGSGSAKK